MRQVRIGSVLILAILATGCQPAQQRLATRVTVERVGENPDQYLVGARVERLDAQGKIIETLAQPRVVCLAGQPAQVLIGSVGPDNRPMDSLTIDVLVPADAEPKVVKLTTTKHEGGVMVCRDEVETPIPAPPSP